MLYHLYVRGLRLRRVSQCIGTCRCLRGWQKCEASCSDTRNTSSGRSPQARPAHILSHIRPPLLFTSRTPSGPHQVSISPRPGLAPSATPTASSHLSPSPVVAHPIMGAPHGRRHILVPPTAARSGGPAVLGVRLLRRPHRARRLVLPARSLRVCLLCAGVTASEAPLPRPNSSEQLGSPFAPPGVVRWCARTSRCRSHRTPHLNCLIFLQA